MKPLGSQATTERTNRRQGTWGDVIKGDFAVLIKREAAQECGTDL
jgi:hypothetical protein